MASNTTEHSRPGGHSLSRAPKKLFDVLQHSNSFENGGIGVFKARSYCGYVWLQYKKREHTQNSVEGAMFIFSTHQALQEVWKQGLMNKASKDSWERKTFLRYITICPVEFRLDKI